jgi:hypothetical protein
MVWPRPADEVGGGLAGGGQEDGGFDGVTRAAATGGGRHVESG